MIFRSDNFYEMFLKWKNYGNMDFKYCFSLNFDYYDNQLYIQQISMNLDSTMENISSRCFMVFVGGKYLDKIGDVMEKVNNVTNDVGFENRPQAVFVIDDRKNIHVDHGLNRLKSTSVMVKYLI